MLPVMSAEAPEQVKSIRKLPTWAVVAVTAAVMAGLFAGYQLFGDSMRWSDPAGHRACRSLAGMIDVDGKAVGEPQDWDALAEDASESKTLAIRRSVKDIGFGDKFPEPDELHAACVGAGMDMPPIA
jgi:hypothetical protein